MFFVKANSHTARNKLFKILDFEPHEYYYWGKEGYWYEVGNISDKIKDKIRNTKGLIIPASVPNGLLKTWVLA